MLISGVTAGTNLALTGTLSASVKTSVLAAINTGGATLVPSSNVVVLGLTVASRRLDGQISQSDAATDRAARDLTGHLTGDLTGNLTGDLTGSRHLAGTVSVTASYSVTSTTLSSSAVSSLINAG